MKRIAVLLWILSLLLPPGAQAAKYAGEFLEIGVGARGVGMGER